MRLSRLVFASLLTSLFVPRAATAAPVIAFGDSWAEQSWPELVNALSAAGHASLIVQNYGMGGTTAEQYAGLNSSMITAALQANPDAEWMYLSIGGNDVFNHYINNSPGTSTAMNDANLRTILDQIFAEAPDIRVVAFGYDRTNFVQDAFCMMQAEQFFYTGVTQAEINFINETELGGVLANLPASYPQFTYIPLWGTLQAAAGQPVTQADPSPAIYMTDCYHLTNTGYRIIHDELVANYWDSEPPPNAAFNRDATALCVGNTTTFTSQSTNNTRVRWFVDGVASGTNNTLALPLTASGPVEIELRAFNTVWSDSATQTITVSPCRDGGVPRDAGPLPPDTGVRDGGVPDAGFVDSGVDRDGGPDRDGGGPTPDSGVDRDGGPDRDTGVRDTGPVTPPRDGGSGPIRDAGPFPGRDGGQTPAATGTWQLGGGCTTAPGDASWYVLVFAMLGLYVRGRSRIRSGRHAAASAKNAKK